MIDFREKSEVISCTTDGATETLYTCPANCRARIPLVYIVNANGTVTLTLFWYRALDDTSYYIIGGKNFGEAETIQLSDAYLVMLPGDKLEVKVEGTTPLVDAICTAEEIFTPSGN